jgi:hypothetical protein
MAIDNVNEKKAYNIIIRFIEDLEPDDYNLLMEKYNASDKVNDFSYQEKNKFLTALVEAHCQMKQQRHVHDTMENRSEFLNHYLGGSTILMKARRSLTNSIDQFMKRRGSKDFPDGTLPIDGDGKKIKPLMQRSMSLSPSSPQTLTFKTVETEKQPSNTSKMDM